MPRAAGLTAASSGPALRPLGFRAFAVTAFLAGQVAAQDVTLTSRDGGVELTGSLVSFDGEFYRIQTEYGELTLDGTGVLCDGPACPDLSAYVADLGFAGPAVLAQGLLPALIDSFGQQQGYAVEMQQAAGQTVYSLSVAEGDMLAARFRVRVTSDDEAFAELIASQVDFVLASRAVLPAEAELASEAGLGDLRAPGLIRVLALDALVPVVSPRNPLREITVEELAAVFSGEIGNWSAVGGVDQPIFLHLPAQRHAIRSAFIEKIMLPLDRALDRGARAHDRQTDLIAAIQGDPFAIGLARQSQLDGVRALTLKGACGYALGADDEAIKSEDYPLPLPLFLYRGQGRLPRIAREFIRFAASPAGQIAVLRAGFVDQSLTRAVLSRQGDRLANAIGNAGTEVSLTDLQELVKALQPLARLSVSFRFDRDTPALDAQSGAKVKLLAEALEAGTLGAGEIVFVGFTDTAGPAEANRRLSLERAQAVRAAVLAEALTFEPGQTSLGVLGFGEAMPLTCEETAWGRHVNRRVEVWVR